MPELPEVETVRRGLAPVLEGCRLARAVARRPDLRLPLPEDFGQRLTGRTVLRVGRRAKYLLIELDDGATLISHLGMSGSFRIYTETPPVLAKHDHVILTTDQGVEIRYNDPRRFGFMVMAEPDQQESHPMIRDIGPEPLDGDFTAQVLARSLHGRKAPIKAALLDQSVVAGLGNIYVAEALFQAGISPKRKAATIAGVRAEKLHRAIVDVLTRAIEAGGSSISDHRQTDGELGYFQHTFAVYGRAGQACPGCDCDISKTGGIARIQQSGRSTFYCTKRQR
ncbi:MAG: bifunctional DNA-formamidopyrimidine glycosylase/DNA-(apurinic or apyrimidinic site) lyase [Rhodospirillaceae bacterium]|jgi:formamidopyrimidine-DNA glycosylase|nr:bifunctional DNA-formamidopyrimidine glycosylase/DNA-(apurinic or apyrimidinic site) lyase [Rhodospirillaceae bacterium]MBT5243089.1 bifunctional DNA-formamidopyrimidine glycosylase/DNA-(apurinic or apyrimidinic site) lyase [Rhodospirillaceae bacterium]MBT5563314.1 bifunctional DNA-formamidopyrimidine glycosylase/DNA-(apurinic or apyrimidinic site) lyase [Rhodospirillaceae bacterium]MBT6243628.1 bifunctional DNA-formamidopyrimidine glycosylase/DNA-(apurinic or apyrimidinic site) lyase [Rhodos